MATDQAKKIQNNIQANNTADSEIDLVEVFYLFLDNIGKIILCMILGGVLAFSYTKLFVKPTYSASSKIYVVSASNNSVIDLSDLQVGSQLTSDYQELLKSRPVLQDVIKNLDLDISYQDLGKQISISNTTDTRILTIDVTTNDPQLSANIANEVVNQAIIYLPKVMETEEPNIVESAVPPEQKAGPSYSKNTLLGILAGGVIMCGILLIQFLMNDTIGTPDDVEKYYGVQPLATIPEGKLKKRKKARGGKA